MRGADEQPGSMFSYVSLKDRVGRTTADLGQERLGGYGPPAKTVAGILPVEGHYTLAVSAPTQLNDKGEAALADLSVKK